MADGSIVIDTLIDSDGIKSGLSKISSIAGTALKGVTVAIGAVSTAMLGLVTASVNARGELEQQIGGVETLFKDSADKVIKNANNAYKTAGMSANEYMQNVTSFSASLLQSTANDTNKAADIADMAMTDMSDNANKMGTSMEAITVAYQGFAKQNYTMLDNLKLGYGGTKTEMERLLADAQKISGIEYNIENLGDVYEAIHVIQQELGITGTTAKEATETLQGSMSMLSASWNNFLSGSGKLSQVVDSVSDVAKNLIRIVNDAIPEMLDSIIESLPEFLELGKEMLGEVINGIVQYLPQLMDSAGQILDTLIQGIIDLLPQLIPTALQIIEKLVYGLLSYLPQILQMGIKILSELISGIAKMLPELIPMAIDCIITLVETLYDNIDQLIDAGIELIMALTDGLIEALPILIERAPEIIEKFVGYFVRNFPKIVQAGGELIGKLAMGILGSIYKLLEVAPQLIANLVNGLSQGWEQIKNIGRYLIEGLWNGISGMANWVYTKITEFAGNIVDNIKGALGIHSPSRVFRDEVGKFMALGLGEGFTDNVKKVYSDMEKAVETETSKLGTSLSAEQKMNIERTSDIQSKITAGYQAVEVYSTLNLDSKSVAEAVNKVNARRQLVYGG